MNDKNMEQLQEHEVSLRIIERDIPKYIAHFAKLNKKVNFLIGLTYFAMILPIFLRAYDLI